MAEVGFLVCAVFGVDVLRSPPPATVSGLFRAALRPKAGDGSGLGAVSGFGGSTFLASTSIVTGAFVDFECRFAFADDFGVELLVFFTIDCIPG